MAETEYCKHGRAPVDKRFMCCWECQEENEREMAILDKENFIKATLLKLLKEDEAFASEVKILLNVLPPPDVIATWNLA